MRKWEEEKVEGENKIVKFVWYVDDILGVWRGDRTELNDKIKSMEEEGNITFLNLKLERGKVDGKIKPKWHQKEEYAGIFCNKRSDVDEGTKNNLVTNMERKIERLTTEEEDRKTLKEQLWEQLKTNGYRVRGKGKRRGVNKEKG